MSEIVESLYDKSCFDAANRRSRVPVPVAVVYMLLCFSHEFVGPFFGGVGRNFDPESAFPAFECVRVQSCVE
jgi:hypothetical protein